MKFLNIALIFFFSLSGVSYSKDKIVANGEQNINWKKIGPTEWDKFQLHMNKVIQYGSNDKATASTFGFLPSINKSEGGALAANGKLYAAPFNATTILEINPEKKTIRNFGNLSKERYKWEGAVLAFNEKIYSFPFNTNSILEIDTANEIITKYGVQSIPQKLFYILGIPGKSVSSDIFGANHETNFFLKRKWVSSVLAPNGKIYGIPYDSKRVLEFDPVTKKLNSFGYFPGIKKWSCGVLAPNGKIYAIPTNSSQILEIDPETSKTKLFGRIKGDFKWAGGVLAPNGKIYGIPSHSNKILEFNPETKEIVTFGDYPGNSKWLGGALAPNGKIYGIPRDSKSILEIDPNTQSTRTFGNFEGDNKWVGGTLAPNGKIYGFPFSANTILEIDPKGNSNFDINVLLSAYLNNH